MKQKSRMTPDEFRMYVASEVESIRSELERLRFAAEHIEQPAGQRILEDAAAGQGLPSFAALQNLPELHKA